MHRRGTFAPAPCARPRQKKTRANLFFTTTLLLTMHAVAPQRRFVIYLYKKIELFFSKWRRTTFEVCSSESPSLSLKTPVLRPLAIHFLIMASKSILWSSGMFYVLNTIASNASSSFGGIFVWPVRETTPPEFGGQNGNALFVREHSENLFLAVFTNTKKNEKHHQKRRNTGKVYPFF